MNTNNKQDRATKNTGTLVILLVILIFGGYLLYLALPMLIVLATNILTLAIMLLVIGGLLFILLHPRTRFAVGSLFNNIFKR